jgi:uncharacterized membrane protein YwzB
VDKGAALTWWAFQAFGEDAYNKENEKGRMEVMRPVLKMGRIPQFYYDTE